MGNRRERRAREGYTRSNDLQGFEPKAVKGNKRGARKARPLVTELCEGLHTEEGSGFFTYLGSFMGRG